MTETLENLKKTISTFISFGMMGGKFRNPGDRKALLDMVTTRKKACKLIDYFNHPENYPKDLYPTYESIICNKEPSK